MLAERNLKQKHGSYGSATFSIGMQAMVRLYISGFEPKSSIDIHHFTSFNGIKTLTVDVWVRIPLLTIIVLMGFETPLQRVAGHACGFKRPTVDCGT
ncbi:hypothetical protein CEXT_290791 [Caerostris extrusa]|uniref:Uncharacterized protein n=1 Tax=Caerostris extrusa TaxID=172846 RepID=A0AAV4SPU2_CAEEX|nr:hypothetical protein CEXT_290791 [Caerostris extrusa]